MMKQEDASVIEHRLFEGEYRLLMLRAPGIAPQVQPGQFVHLRIPHADATVLRRPFSVFKTDNEYLSLLYKAVGKGTRTMRDLRPGESVNLIGPLGRPFPVRDLRGEPVLVAGGYGMAALYLVARGLPRQGLAFFGGRSAPDILCVADFEALGWTVRIATEDGTLGEPGRVTQLLDAWLERRRAPDSPELFACGPAGMLRAVADRARPQGWNAWLSVDEKMGCGVGACLTCVVKTVASGGGWKWARSCREGPVFEARELVWEEMA
jgi:dihydroorotate dehydrogenase electron transfer subunit